MPKQWKDEGKITHKQPCKDSSLPFDIFISCQALSKHTLAQGSNTMLCPQTVAKMNNTSSLLFISRGF